jgi:hypothetical protein
VLTLYRLSPEKKLALLERGVESIHDLDTTLHLSKLAQRQVRAVKADARIVGRQLEKALRPFEGRLAHLDFETVSLAIPVWEGFGPWGQMPVQFSVHKENHPGWPEHFEFLASDGRDCRQEMAEALIEACDGADTVVAYSASFEKRCIGVIANGAPTLRHELEAIASKLVDPLPVIRNHVYDPEFRGSFSLKNVLPALLPDLGYDDLEIAEGQSASTYLGRLLFRPETIPEEEREPLRQSLLAYCERDTLATLRLLQKLREMAAMGAT